MSDSFDFVHVDFVAIEIVGCDDRWGKEKTNQQTKSSPEKLERAFPICYACMGHFEVDDITQHHISLSTNF